MGRSSKERREYNKFGTGRDMRKGKKTSWGRDKGERGKERKYVWREDQ